MFMAAVIGGSDAVRTASARLTPHLTALGGAARLATGCTEPSSSVVIGANVALILGGSPSAVGQPDPNSPRRCVLIGYALSRGAEVPAPMVAGDPRLIDGGEFGLIEADETRVAGMVDPWASRPLFYGCKPNCAVISNDPLAVAAALALRDLDEEVAFEVLKYGHAVTPRTTVREVHRLLPGTRLTVQMEHGRLRARATTYSEVTYDDRAADTNARDFDTATLDATFASLVASAERTLQKVSDVRTIYQITGGLDSRLTLAALAAAGGAAAGDAVTYDLGDRTEIDLAVRVAERLGMRHTTVEARGVDEAAIRAAFLLTGGQIPLDAAVGNLLGYSAAPVAIVGAWPGDVLAGSYVPRTAAVMSTSAAGRAARAWGRRRGYSRAQVARVALRSFVRAHDRAATERVATSVAGQPGATAAHRVTLWALRVRQPAFSFISPASLTDSVMEMTPCLDPSFTRPFLSLRAHEIVGKSFYRRLIHHSIPQLRDVPYGATGAPVDPMPTVVARTGSGLRSLASAARHAVGPIDRIALARRIRAAPRIEDGTMAHLLASVDTGAVPFVDPTRPPASTADVPLLGAAVALALTVEHLRRLDDASARSPSGGRLGPGGR